MDRVTVRSFRDVERAERGIKDLARSRLDTARAVTFQPLGNRFLDAREDPARIAQLLREDAFRAEEGHFSRMALRLSPQLAERLSGLEPRLVERRIEEATRDALLRELPRAQGVYLTHFEEDGRGRLEPVTHVHLSSRGTDGRPAPAITREDARRFEAIWNRQVERGFGISRALARELERQQAPARDSALQRGLDHLRQEWARASARLFALYSDRLSGKVKQQDLVDAAAQARVARAAWTRESNALVDLRDVERRQVFDVVQIRIEGGSRYLQGPLENERRSILELAATRAARLPQDPDKRLAAVAWPAGPDLHATIYFNQREHPTRPPESLDPQRLRAALEARLGVEIQRAASEIDRTATERSAALERVEARLPERETSREQPARSPEPRTETDKRTAAEAIVIALDREFARAVEARTNGGAEDRAAILERLEASQRDLSQERVVIVGLRIPTGAEQLERARLNDEETARVIQRAIDRAYPFLEREGFRDAAVWARHDRALDVQVLVPERLGWTANQLRSPQFQQRFMTGFRQELMNVGRTRLEPAREPLLPSAVRSIATVRQVPQLIRQAEQDPERAARQLARAVFEKLTEALPKPFRVARDLARTVSRFVPRGE